MSDRTWGIGTLRAYWWEVISPTFPEGNLILSRNGQICLLCGPEIPHVRIFIMFYRQQQKENKKRKIVFNFY